MSELRSTGKKLKRVEKAAFKLKKKSSSAQSLNDSVFDISKKKKKQQHLKNPLCFNRLHQMCT
jgi:hypothetical protein